MPRRNASSTPCRMNSWRLWRGVSDQDPERLRFLASLGLKPGTRFTVLARQPFHGPVTLRVEGADQREQVVGFELANSLACTIGEE